MNINYLISSIGSKLLIGVVLVASIILSMLHLLQTLHIYLDQFASGFIIELILFGSLLVLSSAGLYFVFKNNIQIYKRADLTDKTNTSEKSDEKLSLFSVDFQSIGLNFIEGFFDGFTSKNKLTSQNKIHLLD